LEKNWVIDEGRRLDIAERDALYHRGKRDTRPVAPAGGNQLTCKSGPAASFEDKGNKNGTKKQREYRLSVSTTNKRTL